MRVLVFHGYLLHGTGSNVYNARLAEALVRAGHEVHLLCQERDPFSLGWVDAAADWDTGELRVEARREPVRATVYRPDIGGLLPVYVADHYDGVEARVLPELSDDELETYVAANVAAVRAVCERARPDVALANHLVMGPAILARALGEDVPYAVKIHGSALEFVVRPHPERFMPYARAGLGRATAVLVGSRHTAERLWDTMGDPELERRTRLGPPGVDIEEFRPRAIAQLRAAPGRAGGSGSFARREGEAEAALEAVDLSRDRLIVFVGKLMATKGPELLLAAFPLVLAEHPDAKLLIVGFGAWREALERFAQQLATGDVEAARTLRGEDGRELPELAAFLETVPDGYGRALEGRVLWAGRLDHDELAEILPAAEALVAPSTFAEAFGMVAVEGAACGALPVVARHSGLKEVSDALAQRVGEPAAGWLSFEVGPRSVQDLAGCLNGWLGAPEAVRRQTREAIVELTRERWSWDGVARTLLEAAAGRLDGLPMP